MPPEPLLTLEEVAKLLQVNPYTVTRYCLKGDLEYVRLGHRTLRFKARWIEEFIERKQGRKAG
jgi:excisionase family DNA binding protein